MKKNGFTLIEIIVSIIILAIIIIGGFKAYSGVLIGKIKLIEKIDIQKQAFYFSEKFFEKLKKGGTIDYEEYFNRSVVGTASVGSGHYLSETGFGNFGSGGIIGSNTYGDGHYYCRSGSGSSMGTGGCVSSHNTYLDNLNGEYQRYGQYVYQFIDYNYNADSDRHPVDCSAGIVGDEDCDGKITGDYDDEVLGEGPIVFSGSNNVKEIYLISANFKERTLFRWNIKKDLASPNSCDFTTGSGGCAGTIEFLKLEGKDWGLEHDGSGKFAYDGNIDTWLINKEFSGKVDSSIANGIVAGRDGKEYWQPLFGDNINVKDVQFFLYPNKDFKLSWKTIDPKINIMPYIRIKMTLEPTQKARAGIKGKIPQIKINTTVSLSKIYSKR